MVRKKPEPEGPDLFLFLEDTAGEQRDTPDPGTDLPRPHRDPDGLDPRPDASVLRLRVGTIGPADRGNLNAAAGPGDLGRHDADRTATGLPDHG
jgi:hypothetical protein